MTQGRDPFNIESSAGEVPRQHIPQDGALHPEFRRTLGEHGVFGARRAEFDRAHNNAQANQELVTSVVNSLPRTEEVDDLTGDTIIIESSDADWGVEQAMAATSRMLWKQDVRVYVWGEMEVLPAGRPRWIIGERIGVRPGTLELLLAERGARNAVTVRRVRVDAGGYGEARRWSRQELAAGYGERYREMYDPGRGILRVTSESPGVVRMRLARGGRLRQGPEDKERRRLPAEKISDVQIFSDRLMAAFAVEGCLREMTEALGLQDRYADLKAEHASRWEWPVD